MLALRRSSKSGPSLPFECLNSNNCGGGFRPPSLVRGDEGRCDQDHALRHRVGFPSATPFKHGANTTPRNGGRRWIPCGLSVFQRSRCCKRNSERPWSSRAPERPGGRPNASFRQCTYRRCGRVRPVCRETPCCPLAQESDSAWCRRVAVEFPSLKNCETKERQKAVAGLRESATASHMGMIRSPQSM
jgi:hypothetical protein